MNPKPKLSSDDMKPFNNWRKGENYYYGTSPDLQPMGDAISPASAAHIAKDLNYAFKAGREYEQKQYQRHLNDAYNQYHTEVSLLNNSLRRQLFTSIIGGFIQRTGTLPADDFIEAILDRAMLLYMSPQGAPAPSTSIQPPILVYNEDKVLLGEAQRITTPVNEVLVNGTRYRVKSWNGRNTLIVISNSDASFFNEENLPPEGRPT